MREKIAHHWAWYVPYWKEWQISVKHSHTVGEYLGFAPALVQYFMGHSMCSFLLPLTWCTFICSSSFFVIDMLPELPHTNSSTLVTLLLAIWHEAQELPKKYALHEQMKSSSLIVHNIPASKGFLILSVNHPFFFIFFYFLFSNMSKNRNKLTSSSTAFADFSFFFLFFFYNKNILSWNCFKLFHHHHFLFFLLSRHFAFFSLWLHLPYLWHLSWNCSL